MRNNRGISLVEVVIVSALLTILAALAGGTIANMLRVSDRERALLQMDQDANRALEGIKHIVRSAYIPVATSPLDTGRVDALSGTKFKDNVKDWREVLSNGSDLFVFLTGLDTQGDGDMIYGTTPENRRLILGLDPHGTEDTYIEATDVDVANDLDNLGIIDVNPVKHFDLAKDNSMPIAITEPRFSTDFVYPTAGARGAIYGVIRFVPARDLNDDPILVKEVDVSFDFNADGDNNDEFALGRLQVVYPGVTRNLTSNSVLLQLNRNDTEQQSLFELVKTSGEGSTLKVTLVMCNYEDQRNLVSSFSVMGYGMLARTYEMKVKTQLMMNE